MTVREFLSNYSLARRTTLATVLTLVAMLSLAGVALASLFLKGQIDESRVSALTQANVASSTISAAMRFGGYEVIAEALHVFDTGAGHDSAAVYDHAGHLRAELVAPGETTFPPQLSALKTWGLGLADARPVQYQLRDDQSRDGKASLGTLVVNPNQRALRDGLTRALVILGVVLAITALAGWLVARALSRALLKPVEELSVWAEQVSASRNLLAPAPRGGGREVNRLTSSFEALIAQVAEQNRELKRKQYELKASNAHLESIAFSDALTGLPNRSLFESTLETLLTKSNSSGSPLAVLFIDLDHLKVINDVHGHAQGDAALLATAARIRRALRSSDFLARLASDEFAVITPNVTGVDDAVKLGERLTVWLGIALPEDKWAHPLRASVGVAVFPDHGDDVENLVQAADWAMYKAKAFSQDESIRVAAAVATALRSTVLKSEVSNVIAMPIQGRKSPGGKS